MTAPVRECVNPKRRRVAIAIGSQMGKTESLLNVQGQRLDDDPVPMLYVGPTKSNVEKVIEPRIMKMLKAVPSLWAGIDHKKRSSKTLKVVKDVELRLAWSNSPTELASQPAAIVQVDELDRMKRDVGGEGSPLEMVEARFETYADGKSIVTSSPTEGNIDTVVDEHGLERWAPAEPEDVPSAIWSLWQGGTRHEWCWPCPHCGEYFIPRFKLLKWPPGSSPQGAKRDAWLECPRNGCVIKDDSKAWMNERGVYVAPGQQVDKDGILHGDVEDNDTASFWCSGLASPWRTWGQRAQAYVDAVRSGDSERIKAVINTRFGECYKFAGEAPDWQRVADRRRQYSFDQIPEPVQILSCGVDVQKLGLYYAVRGWCPRYESYLIRHGELVGETEHDAIWADLGRVLMTPIGDQRIQLMLIDSGYRPGDKWRKPDNQIYKFCRQYLGIALPSKGHEAQDKPFKASKIDVTLGGQVIKEGLQLWHLDSDFFKSWVHTRVEWPEDQPGTWNLPRDATDDYCQQIVAEARVVKPSGRATWLRLRRQNHYLDTEALNVAAAHIMNVHLLQDRVPAKVAVQAPTRRNRSTGIQV